MTGNTAAHHDAATTTLTPNEKLGGPALDAIPAITEATR
jgi:hypothetical protein